jgi:hypothetical protein
MPLDVIFLSIPNEIEIQYSLIVWKDLGLANFVLHSWKTCNAITAINSMCAISWLHFTCIQESWFNPSPWLLQWDLWEQSDIASKVPSLAHFFLTRRVGLVHPRTWPLFSLSMGSLYTTWSTQEGTLKQRCVPEKWRQVMRSKVFSGR